ncbi:MAG TPA: HAD family hydrolase [Acidimicrobiia bacterium]|nr:HAD family hydrolase [Acidimicrobiia bacterium]
MNRAVLFDIDGTLLDTNYLHALAWRRTFAEHGLEIPTSSVHRRIGMASDRLMEELVGRERDDLKETRTRHFEALKPEIRAFPKAAELLAEVARRGATVVLASSAQEDDLKAMMEALGAGDTVEAVTSSGDVDEAKPSPEVFQVAMDQAGSAPGWAIAVGDTVWDVKAAERAGIGCVCVLTGGISRLELEAAGALAVYEDVAELLDRLDHSPLATLLTG